MERCTNIWLYRREGRGSDREKGCSDMENIYEEMSMQEKGKRERDMRRDEYEGDREEWERDIGKKAVLWRQICEAMI